MSFSTIKGPAYQLKNILEDVNARPTIWGNSEVNDRGEQLFDFNLKTNLNILYRIDSYFHVPCSVNFVTNAQDFLKQLTANGTNLLRSH